jgi:transposase
MSRPIDSLVVSAEDQKVLEERIHSNRHELRCVERARIILGRMRGKSEEQLSKELNIPRNRISFWSVRYKKEGLYGLQDKPGRGRKPSLATEKIEKVITQATQPPEGRVRWSQHSMAAHVGISHSSVERIWRKNGLKPHRIKTFKISKDKNFEEKFWDVIGLYLNPPEKAVVFCCDEKTQCQALERTQPSLPMKERRTQTHDYIRHGTTTLFAALDYATGKILKRTDQKHRNEEWLLFLKMIDEETPIELEIHLILDNYGTHKHHNVKKWLQEHPRFHMHFVPTSSSWMNMVERFFADITGNAIRNGSFESVESLEKAIHAYIDDRNTHPAPYVWKADGAAILAKIQRAKETIARNKLCTVNLEEGH